MTTSTSGAPDRPPLPPGRRVAVNGLTMFIRDSGTSEPMHGSVPIVLLHGLTSTGDLTWFSVFDDLTKRARVIAIDLPGHGSSTVRFPFELESAADAIGGLIDVEVSGAVLVVGFSLGGAVAQLVWKRRREMVAGLVFCSTAASFRPIGSLQRLAIAPAKRVFVGAAVRAPLRLRRAMSAKLQEATIARTAGGGDNPSDLQQWAHQELRRGDPLGVASASAALNHYDATSWVTSIDVPCAAVLTTRDSVVPIERQRSLALAIRPLEIVELDGDHGMFIDDPEPWSRGVIHACDAVLSRLTTPRKGPPL